MENKTGYYEIDEVNSSSLRERVKEQGAKRVRCIKARGEYALYEDEDGVQYLCDGGDTTSEFGDGFDEAVAEAFKDAD